MAPLDGKVAGGFMQTLQNEPLVLALCFMNFALIGFVYYQNASFNTQREANVKLFVQVQTDVQRLLSQCIVPPPMDKR
jgi:hypothetical protein